MEIGTLYLVVIFFCVAFMSYNLGEMIGYGRGIKAASGTWEKTYKILAEAATAHIKRGQFNDNRKTGN